MKDYLCWSPPMTESQEANAGTILHKMVGAPVQEWKKEITRKN